MVFVRIISGKYKNKKINGFLLEGTRPTKDRVKESLFAIIQNYLQDSIFLDLFAGSGSVGIEALSNGAKKCYFVEKEKRAIKILSENLKNIDSYILLHDDYINALSYFKKNNITFDIIFLDPPYHLNLISSAIYYIKKNNLLNKNGIIVCEYLNEPIPDIYKILKTKNYGITNIKIFKNDDF